MITVISVPLIFIGLVVGYNQVREILVLPDPSLEFVHPSSVAYKTVNNSGKIAEDILVSFGIFDLESPVNGPLAIPSVPYDYVNRNSAKGPFSCFESFATAGHRYFGIVYIGCKGGRKLRTYWIYVRHGYPEEGFYAERKRDDTYQVDISRLRTDTSYLRILVPEDRRRIIK